MSKPSRNLVRNLERNLMRNFMPKLLRIGP